MTEESFKVWQCLNCGYIYDEEAGDADREGQDRGNHPVRSLQPYGVMRLFRGRGGRNLGALVRELRLGIGKRARCIAVSHETHVYSGS